MKSGVSGVYTSEVNEVIRMVNSGVYLTLQDYELLPAKHRDYLIVYLSVLRDQQIKLGMPWRL